MAIAIPDPPFGEQTEADVRTRMFDSMSSGLDKAQGSMAWNLIAPLAIEISQLWEALDQLVLFGFAQTTYGQFLDARAEEHGVTRKLAQLATGQVTFTGVDGTVIPAGTQVSNTVLVGSNDEPILFQTDSDVTIAAGTAVADITAIFAGEDGNLPAVSIDRMINIVAGVTGISNVAETEGGTDDETDEELRTRLLVFVAARQGAGTADDYETWALEVDGVGAAAVEPLWAGAGTVRVQLLGTDGQPAGAGVITAAEEYIQTLRPIGADVTVTAPAAVTVDVDVTLTVEAGYTVIGVQSAVEASLQAYFDTLDPGDDVILSEVGAAIVTTLGIADYSALELDGVASNFAISGTEIAQLGTVTLA